MEIKGIIAAMATAMYEDGSINESEIRNQVNRHIQAGVDGIFCLGTNGEFYILSTEEKKRVMRICVDEARGRVPVYAGTGCVGTQDTIDLSLAAQEIGVDVLSVITPYFAALSQEELYRHYADIAAAVKLPIVMYNIPMRTGCAIEPETVSRLAKDFSNIRGVTDPEHFSVLSGNDALILKTLQNGGKGGITAVANILPEMMVSIYQNWKKGDMAAAEAAQQGIQPIRDCFKYGNPNSIVKRAANLIGQPLGPCRKPFGMVSEETDNAILDTIDRYYAAYKR